MRKQKITLQEFSKLIKKSKILEKCNFGEKILLTPDEKIIKIFYRKKKRLFGLPYSHAQKFIRKAWQLHKRKIDTITPEILYYCPENKSDIVIYSAIPGSSVRNMVCQGNRSVLKKLAEFIAYLHKRNIYFRAGHLGNFIYQTNGHFALIDVSNLKFNINLRRKAKSIAYLLNHRDDREILKKYGYKNFIKNYLDAAKLTKREETIFYKYLDLHLD